MTTPPSAAAGGFVPLLIGMAMTIVDVPMMAIAMPGIGEDLGLGTGPLALIAGAYPPSRRNVAAAGGAGR
jgi:hypothetical protein